MAKRLRAAPPQADGEVLANLETLFGPPEDAEEEDLSECTGLTDLEVLQGTWHSVSGRRRAVFLVSGTRFTVRFEDGDIYMGVFELVAALPRLMDMRIDEGPARH